jgi:Fur family ferric uptake transcriptional regulator
MKTHSHDSGKAHAHHDHEAKPDLEELTARLKEAKLSVTPARLGILSLLAESHRVWSIEEILAGLKKKSKKDQASLVFTTVYRCLLKLEEAGFVREIDLGDGVSRYEYKTCEEHHHHHVVCKTCGTIAPLDDCEVTALENSVKKLGYQQIQHRLEFFGVCKPCQSSSTAKRSKSSKSSS